MDCPHLNVHSIRVPSILVPFNCSACQSAESPWLCLHCGGIHCGRYVRGHGQLHYEQKKHPIVIDCHNMGVFCYECDDYIVNVHQHRVISTVTDRLNAIHRLQQDEDSTGAHDETSNSSAGSASDSVLGSNVETTSKTGRQPRRGKVYTTRGRGKVSKASNVDLLPPSPSPPASPSTTTKGLAGGRKRSSAPLLSVDNGPSARSANSNGGDLSSQGLLPSSLDPKKPRLANVTAPALGINGLYSARRAKENVSLGIGGATAKTVVGKHGVVGLRNLGNTCFMNAVLQSLSKIRGFSCYMVHIPPPDQLLATNNSGPTRRIYSTRARKRSLLAASSSQNSLNGFNRGSGFTEAMAILRTEELLTNELRKILILLNTKGSSAVSPDSLFSIIWEVMPRFRGYQQQDAHEFLRYMLDQLHNELIRLIPAFSWEGLSVTTKKSKSIVDGVCFNGTLGGKGLKNGSLSETFMSVFGYNSIVTSMFGGILENEVRCSSCGTESRKNDPFLDLSLDIPSSPGGEPRLEDCLSNFTDVEELSDDDKYFCSHCKNLQKSTKRFAIQRLPNVLCLHLKRFRWSNYLRTKLDHFVQFPMTSLDMSSYLLNKLPRGSSKSKSNSHLYDLAAVIVHHGSGVGSGHYTAFAKKDGQWYHFNDSAVKPSEESAVAKCKAYILFYTRAEFKL